MGRVVEDSSDILAVIPLGAVNKNNTGDGGVISPYTTESTSVANRQWVLSSPKVATYMCYFLVIRKPQI